MKLLAVETSSNACSVALQIDDTIMQQHVVEARAHTRLLVPMITSLLGEARLEANELDALVLGNGPGSFIGMRIGASVVQGLAYSSGLKIIPVSSLAAIAADVFAHHQTSHVAVAQDARMSEVYLGCFVRGDDELPVLLAKEKIHKIQKIDALCAAGDIQWYTAGAAWQRYPELAARQKAQLINDAQTRVIEFPRARYLLGLAAAKLLAGEAIAPEELQPAYLRTQVATPPQPVSG